MSSLHLLYNLAYIIRPGFLYRWGKPYACYGLVYLAALMTSMATISKSNVW